jgi:hypothetical protein
MPVEIITDRNELLKLMHGGGGSRRHKYNAKKVKIGDRTFDSKLEAARYCELRVLESRGEIKDLTCQVTYVLVDPVDGDRGVHTRPDFQYEREGKRVVEDTKGIQTQDSKNKMKMFRARYGFTPKIIKKSSGEVSQILALWAGIVEQLDAGKSV